MSHTADPATEITARLGDTIGLRDDTSSLAAQYWAARPFPHLILDNLFADNLLDDLVAEIPEVNDQHWVHHDDDRVEKYSLRSAIELGPTGSRLTAFLHSAAFLYLLSQITGIWQLLPDPYLQGAGYSIIPQGAKFDVHCDRNTLYETGLARRLALIIYLNKNWEHEYGGQLELWNQDGTRAERIIEPAFNRTVIFEIGDKNYHGIPAAVAAPHGRARKSFNLYYHTAHPPATRSAPHTSIYAPSFYQKRMSIRRLARELTPPFLVRAFRRVYPAKVY